MIYFTASWCAPCKALLPKVLQTAALHGVPLRVVDIDENRALAEEHRVTSVPTIVLPNGEDFHPAQLPWTVTRDKIIAQASA